MESKKLTHDNTDGSLTPVDSPLPMSNANYSNNQNQRHKQIPMLNFTYQYDDSDIKEFISSKGIPVGLSKRPITNQKDKYHFYCSLPYAIDDLSIENNQDFFLRDLLAYFTNVDGNIKERRVAFPLNMRSERHWITIGLTCSKPNMEKAKQLNAKIEKLNQDVFDQDNDLIEESIENLLANEEIKTLLRTLYSSTSVSIFNSSSVVKPNQQGEMALFQSLTNAYNNLDDNINYQVPFKQEGLNDCGVIASRVAWQLFYDEYPHLEFEGSAAKYVLKLRQEDFNNCPGISDRQQPSEVAKQNKKLKLAENQTFWKQFIKKKRKNAEIRTRQFADEVLSIDTNKSFIDNYHPKLHNYMVSCNKVIDEILANDKLTEDQQQQMIDPVLSSMITANNKLIKKLNSSLNSEEDQLKIKKLEVEIEKAQTWQRRWGHIRNMFASVSIVGLAANQIIETIVQSICDYTKDQLCHRVSSWVSLAVSGFVSIVPGTLAYFANRAETYSSNNKRIAEEHLRSVLRGGDETDAYNIEMEPGQTMLQIQN